MSNVEQDGREVASARTTGAEEFVEDREVGAAADDRFGHADLVAELRELVLTTKTPTNIALYGPWGSGKSGIGNMLAESLSGDDCVFVRFDAFKYAADPLKRQFLTRIAEKVLPAKKAKTWNEDLYRSKTTSTLSLTEIKSNPFLRALAWAFVVVMAIIAVIGAVTRFLFDGNASAAVRTAYAVLIPTGVVVAFLLGLLGKTLPVTTERGQPSSDEQYEEKFRELVKKVVDHGDRLVVFIDELDRCAPEAVVELLATIRTFLDIPGCVFVVAADQQVLEQALSRRTPHATPHDPDNPYYSTGSEYLDKIFHHQISIPPIRLRRLTRFSVELVRDRPGVWSRLPDLERTISVLVPSHVRSPRRVKALLNSFVHLNRIAQRRVERGALATDLIARADELAVLTVLRLEFPLFARELAAHPRLPHLVRDATGDAAMRPTWCLEAEWRLALAFLHGEQATDILLDEELAERVPNGMLSASGDDPVEPDLDAPRATNLNRIQSGYLVAYLLRTSRVPGPAEDLIHLEHGGYARDLDPTLAAQLERLAVDGDRGGVADMVTALDDRDQRRSALLVLADLLREAVGFETANIVAALLASAMACPDESLDAGSGSLDYVIDLVTSYAVSDLDPRDLVGGLRLATRSHNPQAKELARRIIERVELGTDEELADAAAALLPRIDGEMYGRLGEAIGAHIAAGASERIPKTLAGLDAQVIARVAAPLTAAVSEVLAKEPESVVAVANAVQVTAPSARALAEALAVALLGNCPFSEQVFLALTALAPAASPELVAALLAAAQSEPEHAGSLLGVLGDGVIDDASQRAAEQCAGVLAARVVSSAAEAGSDDSGSTGLDHLRRAGLQVSPESDVLDQIVVNLPSPIATADEAQRRDRGLEAVFSLLDTEMFPKDIVADRLAAVLVSTQNPSGLAELPAHFVNWAPRIAALTTPVGARQLADYAAQFLTEPQATIAWLDIADSAAEPPDPPRDLAGMSAWRDSHSDLNALAKWIRIYNPSPADAYELLAPTLDRVPGEGATDLGKYAAGLSPTDRAALIIPEIARCVTSEPHRDYLAPIVRTGPDMDSLVAAILQAHQTDAAAQSSARLIELANTLHLTVRQREELVRELISPALRTAAGDTAVFDAVQRAHELLRDLSAEVRRLFRDALRAAADRVDRRDQAERLLDDLGYKKRSIPIIGSKQDV